MNKKANQKKNKGKAKAKDYFAFREILFLLVSLIQGSLFFILAEQTVSLINSFSLECFSNLIFFYVILFRILQTHLLAAIKYDNKWDVNPFDFILVFITAILEYILFSYEQIQVSNMDVYYITLLVFCVFGAIGYLITYMRTCKNTKNYAKTERIVHMNNILSLVIIAIIYGVFYCNGIINPTSIIIRNIIATTILGRNIYISIKLSRNMY